jgi:hypothetical protein
MYRILLKKFVLLLVVLAIRSTMMGVLISYVQHALLVVSAEIHHFSFITSFSLFFLNLNFKYSFAINLQGGHLQCIKN